MVEELEYRAHIIRGIERTVVACVGEERGGGHRCGHLESVAGVERVMPVLQPFKLASREVRPKARVSTSAGSKSAARGITVIAGPCAVESARSG